MAYILFYLIILIISIFGTIIFNKKIDVFLPISYLYIILIVFVFGMFNNLLFGSITIIISILLMLYLIIKKIVKKDILWNNIFTAGLLFYTLSFIVIVIIFNNKQVSDWDELSHWALIVKNMYLNNNFAMGLDSTLRIKNYINGSAIIEYFMMFLNGSYKESILYISLNSFIFALFSSALSIFDLKKDLKNYNFYLMIFLFVFLPTIFCSKQVYHTILLDGLIGIIFAIAISTYYKLEKNDKYYYFIIISYVLLLSFIKDFGLILACSFIAIIMFDQLLKKKKVIECVKAFMLIIPAIVLRVTWSIVVKIYSSGNTFIETNSLIDTIKHFITFNLSHYEKDITMIYIKAFFKRNICTIFRSISMIMIIMMIVILIIYLIKFMKNKNAKKRVIMFFVSSMIMCVFYFTILLIVVITKFPIYEAYVAAQYPRYAGSFALGLLLSVIILIVYFLKDNKKHLTIIMVFMSCCLLVSLNYKDLFNYEKPNIKARTNYNSFLNQMDFVSNKDKTYFISSNDSGYDYRMAKYLITPKKLNIDDYSWSIIPTSNDKENYQVVKSREQFYQELMDNYDYVYIYEFDEDFKTNYGIIFDNLKNNQLYKVEINNEQLNLITIKKES